MCALSFNASLVSGSISIESLSNISDRFRKLNDSVGYKEPLQNLCNLFGSTGFAVAYFFFKKAFVIFVFISDYFVTVNV